MRKYSRLIGVAAALAFAVAGAACRGDDDNTGDDDTTNPDGGNGDGGGGTTIYDVQNDAMAVGTAVTLRGVVVTAIDSGHQGVYVQEKAGGPFSGVLVFKPTNLLDVKVGDVVDVLGGAKDEFMYNGGANGTPDDKSFTELAAPDGGSITLVKTGATETIAPAVVDPAAIGASEDEAEKWEGVLIKLDNVAVLSAPKTAGSAMEMKVSGPFRVQSGLTDLAVGGVAFKTGDCFASITGVVNYFYDYKLLPRQPEDYVTGGTMCPPPENDMATCTDSKDNDLDGFSDCLDLSCQNVAGVNCTVDTTVEKIQMPGGGIVKGQSVTLKGVFVTAVAKYKTVGVAPDKLELETRVWVADSLTAAPYQGIMVFKPTISGATVDDLQIGSKVDVTGFVDEFFGLTQIANSGATLPAVTLVAAPTAMPTPAVVTIDQLADPAMAEPYEGVLVTVVKQPVLSANPDAAQAKDFGEWSIGTMAKSVRVDDIMVKRPNALTVGTDCYTVTGALDYGFNLFKLEPRIAGDVVKEATCN